MSNLPPPPGSDPYGQQPYQQPPPYGQAPPPAYGGGYGYGGQQPKTSGLAVAGMVCGICGLVFFCLYGIPGLVGLVLSLVALKQIGDSQGALKGRGMAIAGAVTGGLSVLMGILLVIAVIADNS